jgi:ATP/maltotriose-dependent transcriptional regulator MalT
VAANRAETHVKNREMEKKIENDLEKYDILYICAPFGWGKYALLADYYQKHRKESVYWLEETKDFTLEQQIENLPKQMDRTIIIPKLEQIMSDGQQELIWNLISHKQKNDSFLIASTRPMPDELLPFTIFYQVFTYGISDLKPSNEDVKRYFEEKGILLQEEELLRIEKDFRNMPLCMYLLENPLRGAFKGYGGVVRKQCMKDVFIYIDVVFFRTFTLEEQNALLNLFCFEWIDEELVSFALNITEDQAGTFLRKLVKKGSVLEPQEKGWKFEKLFGRFLARAAQKYLDGSEIIQQYKGAMHYFEGKEAWMEALRFSYMVDDHEKMADHMNEILKNKTDYNCLLSLQLYLECLPEHQLMKYPTLLFARSMLEALNGELEASKAYEKKLLWLLDRTANSTRKSDSYKYLLHLALARPGGDDAEEYLALLKNVRGHLETSHIRWNEEFQPNHVSLLHGDKDFCRLLVEKNGLKEMGQLADYMKNTLPESFMTKFLFFHAEVLYEYNRLDEALDLLVDCQKRARSEKSIRLQLLCLVKIMDLQIARQQMNRIDAHLLERMEEYMESGNLIAENVAAHQMYYDLLHDNRDRILRWMKNEAPDETERFYCTQHYQYLMKAKCYIWMENYVMARMILQTLLDFAQKCNMDYLKMQVMLLEAVIYYREKNPRWKFMLMQSLEEAKVYGFIRIFADEGAAVYDVLNDFAKEEPEWEKNAWFKKVLHATRAQMLQYPSYLQQKKSLNIHLFSEYEKAVMRLLASGEKNAQIAKKLSVSENTVKYHLKSVYQKLEVGSRSQAINRITEEHLF